jgi:F-type H+-transporting ATPase subunit a
MMQHGHLKYWWRPGNADLNTTAALGIIAAVFSWAYFVLRYAGFKTLVVDLFGNKADRKDVGTAIWIFLIPIFIMVGLIEVVSILFRPVSLAFRLFGNVFGGENLLANMTGLVPYIVPVPFYFLETLIGLVQALVFTLLTAVYIGLICNHGEEGEHH